MAVPSQPTSFFAQQGDGQVLLSWNITTGATSYSIQRSVDGVTYAVIDTAVVNNYLDTTVSVGTLYYYKVAAVNGTGTGPYTSAQQVIPSLAGQLSLGEMRLRAQQTADRENSQFLTLPEWNFNINQSAKEFYDLLITAYEDYFIAPRLLFTTDGSTYDYDLPNGQNLSGAPAFYKLYGVDCGLDASTNAWISLKKFDFIQRNQYVYPQVNSSFLGVFNLQYRVMGNKIRFIPTPSGNQQIGLWYFPRQPALLQDTDMLDGIGGWTEYVIVDAAIKALRKEESDTSLLNEQKMMLKKRIEEAAQNRDAGQGDTISDTRSWGDRYGSPFGNGSWGGY
jgi:hypothetical protein